VSEATAAPEGGKHNAPQADRQMSEAELQAEDARNRAAAYVGLLAVLLFVATFVFNYMFIRTLNGHTDNATRLIEAHDHAWLMIVQALCYSVASVLLGLFLAHLALALRSRRPALPKLMTGLAFGGPVIVALTMPLFMIGTISAASDFSKAANQTVKVADDLMQGGFITAARYALAFGLFLTAIAFVMVCIYSIRVGLLTTLTGGVGVAIGVLYVIGAMYAEPVPLATLIEIFWIGAVAIMLASNPSQKPPAWPAGTPISWSEVRAAAAAPAAPPENPAEFEKPAEPSAKD